MSNMFAARCQYRLAGLAGRASSAEMAVVDGGATNCSNHLKPRSGRRDGEGGERGDGEDDKATM
jgi:hypothetical protein